MSTHQAVGEELANVDFLESLYFQYQVNPHQLDSAWRNYFQAVDQLSLSPAIEGDRQTNEKAKVLSATDCRIESLIDAYRRYGHLMAKVNPIALHDSSRPLKLDLKQLGFEQEDLHQLFPTSRFLTQDRASLAELLEALQALYCHRVGFEFKGIDDFHLEGWLQGYIENDFYNSSLSIEQKRLILEYLNRSELLEAFLHTKYVGQKRFSLEGTETLIPMLALLIESGAELGVEEVVLGMAHRGRLNVLVNILNKSLQAIFVEFDEHHIPESYEGMGDVKYHKGYKGDYVKTHTGKKIALTLSPNPSHLESVDSVVEGQVRAKQMLARDSLERNKVIPILIHGDAALSGQGVVYESLQMAKLSGYTTGGTIHLVINNQIGFTTVPRDLRSTPYCTDIARTFGLPIFHVNAEDPESCVKATLLALQIRQQFHCDVFIDINGYRKYGHNEGDEPAFTQPLEYAIIRKKRPIRELYRDQLLEQGLIQKEEIEQLENDFRHGLQEAHARQKNPVSTVQEPDLMNVPPESVLFHHVQTGVAKETLVALTECFSAIPKGFHLHAKLEHLVKERVGMVKEEKPLDWGMAEYLAYATLLAEGVPVRLSGQDSCRGTFSHRHAIWVDQKEEKEYYPLAHLKEGQGHFEVINSPLSEMAVLGFEYGYSVACLQGLTIWEAQFGDFSNGAQVIIDQYIVSGEQKWGQTSKLVLFLPHGYEGQGPEHSSGRLERFLTLAGHDNIQVVNPTTPAQFFHLLRRQVYHRIEKPLVVFTPKGLLRHPACISWLDELTHGSFQEILDEAVVQPIEARRLVLCSGRIYYDLIAQREREKRSDIAIIRIEQLYPLHRHKLKEMLARYSHIQLCQWVQEEPKNMGAWSFIFPYLDEALPRGIPLFYIGRERSATPATGSHSRHEQEHSHLLQQVFQT